MTHEQMKADLARAKEHVDEGESALIKAKYEPGVQQQTAQLTAATAHFTAAMAITNILLTEPFDGGEE